MSFSVGDSVIIKSLSLISRRQGRDQPGVVSRITDAGHVFVDGAYGMRFMADGREWQPRDSATWAIHRSWIEHAPGPAVIVGQ